VRLRFRQAAPQTEERTQELPELRRQHLGARNKHWPRSTQHARAGAYNYEKAQATTDIISAIKAAKIIPSLDRRIRLSDGGAQRLSSRRNGFPLTASTNRKSFTDCFYEGANPDASDKKPSRKNKFIQIMEMVKPSGGADEIGRVESVSAKEVRRFDDLTRLVEFQPRRHQPRI
jgi:hypothetical protein